MLDEASLNFYDVVTDRYKYSKLSIPTPPAAKTNAGHAIRAEQAERDSVTTAPPPDGAAADTADGSSAAIFRERYQQVGRHSCHAHGTFSGPTYAERKYPLFIKV